MVDLGGAVRFFRENIHAKTAVALLAILLVGILDYQTGIELDFSIFYLLPIYWIAWQGGMVPGVIASLSGAIAWLLADLHGGHVYTSVFHPLWSTVFRFSVFLLTAWLLTRLKTAQERRRTLERIFFHDILNVVGAIRGYAELLRRGGVAETQEIVSIIHSGANQVIDQIELQRMVSAAQNRELVVSPQPLQSRSFLEQQIQLYRDAVFVRGCRLEVDPDAADVPFASDPVLLGRVLGNMLKNALEASQPEDTVTVGCNRMGEEIEFWVHNRAHIPPAAQARIFQSDFSTKGMGRGLGTYGMQLLTRYLKGRITFSSSPEAGTVFRARYPLRW